MHCVVRRVGDSLGSMHVSALFGVCYGALRCAWHPHNQCNMQTCAQWGRSLAMDAAAQAAVAAAGARTNSFHSPRGLCGRHLQGSAERGVPARGRDLFERPCARTGQLLAMDASAQALLPPLARPFRHVRRARLLAAARAPRALPAYHLQAAPAGAV